jgi:MIP family channel proteins
MHEHQDPPSASTLRRPVPLERAAAAELLGSFLVVFVSAGSVVTAGAGGGGVVGVALASGFAFAAALTTTLPRSGGGVNPALTAAFWIAGRLTSVRAAAYVSAQLLGAIVAGLLLRLTIPEAMWRPSALGAPLLPRDVGAGPAAVLEAILTFALTTTAFAILVDDRGRTRALAGLMLGLVLAAATLVAWPLTGAALNPARALGPELASGTWSNWWVYWIGPGAGAVIAAVAYWSLFLREPDAPSDRANARASRTFGRRTPPGP